MHCLISVFFYSTVKLGISLFVVMRTFTKWSLCSCFDNVSCIEGWSWTPLVKIELLILLVPFVQGWQVYVWFNRSGVWTQGFVDSCLSWVSIAVIKQWPVASWGGKDLFYLAVLRSQWRKSGRTWSRSFGEKLLTGFLLMACQPALLFSWEPPAQGWHSSAPVGCPTYVNHL